MKISYLMLLFTAIPTMCQAQLLTFGVKGGVSAQTPLRQAQNGVPFTAGPTVNIRISPRLSLETGVMFDRMGESSSTAAFLSAGTGMATITSFSLLSNQQRAHAVEIPLTAKLYLLSGQRTWRPFVSLGGAMRWTTVKTVGAATTFSSNPLGDTSAPQFFNTTRTKANLDPVAGLGVDFKAGRIHLDPEVRYSYWGAAVNQYPLRNNQVEVLFGFRF